MKVSVLITTIVVFLIVFSEAKNGRQSGKGRFSGGSRQGGSGKLGGGRGNGSRGGGTNGNKGGSNNRVDGAGGGSSIPSDSGPNGFESNSVGLIGGGLNDPGSDGFYSGGVGSLPLSSNHFYDRFTGGSVLSSGGLHRGELGNAALNGGENSLNDLRSSYGNFYDGERRNDVELSGLGWNSDGLYGRGGLKNDLFVGNDLAANGFKNYRFDSKAFNDALLQLSPRQKRTTLRT